MTDPAALVAALDARLRPLETEVAEAWWLASTRVSEEHDRRRVAADLALRDALAAPDAFAALEAARANPVDDPLLQRAVEVLHGGHLSQQVPADLRAEIVELEAAVDSTFNAFRGTMDGGAVDDNTILGILRTSDDVVLRRAAWEASKQVGREVADQVRTLARARNRAARALGRRDHFALSLEVQELDEERLFATLAEVDRVTGEAFGRWKASVDEILATRFGTTPAALRPWHYDDPFLQEPPVTGAIDLDRLFADADLEALTTRTFDGLGLETRAILGRSDLEPRAGKSQHAFCTDIDRAGDVRVLCNNVPNERWTSTMLHELGHAVYFDGVSRDLPWVLRTMHPLTTEGVAMLCGRLVRDPEWLQQVAGVPADEVQALTPRLRAARRAALLVFARWVLVMTHFERELYADPDGDLDTIWWDLVERFQHVTRPDERAAPDWAAKIHLAVAPVYYQNYLYGEMTASQLEATLRARTGGLVDRTEAGAMLTAQVFGPGASLRWDHLLEAATGEPLSPRFFAADLVEQEG